MRHAVKLLAITLIYMLAGIPAAIGVTFVARYAFITSDTPIDGAATAFLFGMVALGAFVGPAIAVRLHNKGRIGWAIAWGFLCALAIIVNWTHTLAAIGHRGAGIEAESSKQATTIADARRALERVERDLAAMPPFVPTTEEAVKAARAAVELASRNRLTECGPNNETRGTRCREREADERARQDALAAALANKGTTDRASMLGAEASALRRRLVSTQPPPPANALGQTLGRLLPVSAASAATLQQAVVAAVAELLIAAILALPELLRSAPAGRFAAPGRFAREEKRTSLVATDAEIVLPAAPDPSGRVNTRRLGMAAQSALTKPSQPPIAEAGDGAIDLKPLVAFLAECVPHADRDRTDWADIYASFLEWQQRRGGEALTAALLGGALKHVCELADIRIRRQGDRVYCLDRRIAWKN